jgi:hypothetical protein
MPTAQYVEPHPPKPYIELTVDYKCQLGYEMPNYTERYLDWQQQKPRKYQNVISEVIERQQW